MRNPLIRYWTGLVLTLVCTAAGSAAAQERPDPEAPLRVAVREVPPFAIQDPGGTWSGLSVELWTEVARVAALDFEWVEMPLDATVRELASGGIDVGVAALTITPEREQRFDFSHAYYVGGLALAYPAVEGSAWGATLRGFLSPAFFSAVGTLFLILLAAGFVLWVFERKRNAEEFGGGSIVRGVGDGFWWSAVTMTTVGYGDKAPRTVGGRIVALVWMFASLILIAGLTASIAASLTTHRLESSRLLERPVSDLRVGVLEGSAAQAYVERRGGRFQAYARVVDALDAMSAGEVEVVLHDSPVLKYHARQRSDGMTVAAEALIRDDYGFGLAAGSPWRERVNRALLTILREPAWQEMRAQHLGETAKE